MSSAQLHKHRECRVLGVAFLGMLIVSLVVMTVATIYGIRTQRNLGPEFLFFLNVPGLFMFASTVGLACTRLIREGRLVWLMRITIALVLLAVILYSFRLWLSLFRGMLFSATETRVYGSIAIALLVLILNGQLVAPRTQSATVKVGQWLASRWVAVYGIATIVIIMSWPYWTFWSHEILVGLSMGGAFTLVLVAVTIVAIQHVNKPKQRAHESIADRIKLRMLCPKCETDQTLPAGLRRCAKCRLALLIEVEEPRCECGYLTYQLAGTTCPECGRSISQSHGSGAAAS